ncbi:UNVERIFIED_CONTAM: Growth-regulating factor 8 [Sesamum angustifolium]|uniref:Growth-regulating factor n=1 Tax=Sesamum angustifolium TaxID=2727405 RepID=A0AAW2M6M6_9LAMI
MRNGSERKSSSPSMLDCDVGLGLKMQLQPSESYSCKKGMVLNLCHYHRQPASSGRNANLTSYAGDGGGSGGPSFGNGGNQVACFGDLYGAADTLSLPRISHSTAFGASGGSMAVSGKFHSSQWQELERQKVIHKYIMASIPVPPQLLLPTSSTSPLPALSQSNTSGLDLRFSSNGSDPEPWRCKRTDGKKWRCSRDVAPDQKYCERHAHKSRPRSRKHVEVSAHNPSSQQPPLILPAASTTTTTPLTQPLQTSTSQFPTMASAASFDQARCVEWFMRGGGSSSSSSSRDPVPVSTFNQQQQQQWQQLIHTSSSSSSRLELNRDNTDHAKNVSLYQYEGNKQGFMSLNQYIPDPISLQRLENHQHQLSSSFLDSKMGSLREGCLSLNTDQGSQTTTRHFIDALSKKFSPSALSLSMSGGNGAADDDNENSDLGNVGMMMNSDRDSDGVLKSQWLSSASWMNSPPGGPLGEALCLGNASGTRAGGSNLPSPHGYSNSNTNSSCSKSSCEDGSHALNFIG